jgi:NitT/TauT family transport system substrate-binding protein
MYSNDVFFMMNEIRKRGEQMKSAPTRKPHSRQSLSRIAARTAVTAIIAATLPVISAGAQAQGVEKVTFGWPAAYASTLAHAQFGVDLGFFKDEKLELEIVPLQGSFPVIQQILAGQLTTGYVGLEAPIISRQPGKTELPLKFFYNYLRSSIWEIVVLPDSPIKNFTDIKGKSVGVAGMSFGNIPVTKAWLGMSGMKESDITFQTVGMGAAAFRALTTRQVDALNLWDSMHATLEASGTPLRRVPPPAGVEDGSSHGFPVLESTLKNKSDLLARFGRAWSKSIVACDANPEACIKSFWKAYPAQKPSTGTEQEKMQRELKVVTARLDKLTSFRPAENRQFGSFSEVDWTGLIKAQHMGGAITKTDIPLNELYTNELVPAMNKFDPEAVTKAAKAVKN